MVLNDSGLFTYIISSPTDKYRYLFSEDQLSAHLTTSLRIICLKPKDSNTNTASNSRKQICPHCIEISIRPESSPHPSEEEYIN